AHAHVLASRGHTEVLRHDGDFTRTVVHFVEPQRDERQPPRARDDSADADGSILITAWMALEINDVGIAKRKRAGSGACSEGADRDGGDDPADAIPHGRPLSSRRAAHES